MHYVGAAISGDTQPARVPGGPRCLRRVHVLDARRTPLAAAIRCNAAACGCSSAQRNDEARSGASLARGNELGPPNHRS
jgi:hypothetical protein